MVNYFLYSNFYGESYTEQDYLTYLEDTETPAVLDKYGNPEGFFEWLADMERMDFEDLELNLKYSDVAGETCRIYGSLGLWNGRHDIEPVECDDLWSAITKCAQGMDNISVQMCGGVIKVIGGHHDGRNVFTIRRASGYFYPRQLF